MIPISSILQNLPGGQSPSNTVVSPNTGAAIIFTALHRNNMAMKFLPYDFEFDDSFKPEWNSQESFGRMDPMMTYKRTTREATLSFNAVAEYADSSAEGSAQYNFQQLQNFLYCLYPTYENPESTTVDTPKQASSTSPPAVPAAPPKTAAAGMTAPTVGAEYGPQIIKAAPIFKVSFMNLLNNSDYVIAVTSFKHKFKFDSGGTSLQNGKMIPGEFNVSISFKILHTKTPSNIQTKYK